MILWRTFVALAIISGAALGLAAPAGAGGSNWDVEPDVALPGQQVTAGTCVAWAHNDDLGTPDDGPYSMWISPIASDEATGGVASVSDGAVLVGEITIDEGGLWKNCGPNAAHIVFTVPDLAPGDYELIHCNASCTKVLGDITSGVLTVAAADGSVPAAPSPTTVAPTTTSAPHITTTTPPTTADRLYAEAAFNSAILMSTADEPSSDGYAAWWVGGALALATLTGWIVVRQR